ncbi:protein of unknown function (plasmid) [Cupriavidus taiwanensis]|uniref:Uncharacterized protein n=1 Tax=Cupriavidus taiwanensis TaxID=164546 RepID=A0A375FF03_9BURK|nr:protein of unknown function [Cupriavidus taiwanensis]SPD69010.1 protein of unknown function [Cupriavidus taiwanensis]
MHHEEWHLSAYTAIVAQTSLSHLRRGVQMARPESYAIFRSDNVNAPPDALVIAASRAASRAASPAVAGRLQRRAAVACRRSCGPAT